MRVRPAFPFLLWHQNLNIVINERCQGFLLPKHTIQQSVSVCICKQVCVLTHFWTRVQPRKQWYQFICFFRAMEIENGNREWHVVYEPFFQSVWTCSPQILQVRLSFEVTTWVRQSSAHSTIQHCWVWLVSHHESVRSHKCVNFWSKPRIYQHVLMQENLYLFIHRSDCVPHISGVW